MLNCITYGWYPPIARELIRPRANLANSKATLLYNEQVDKEFTMMLEHGFVSPVDSSMVTFINPIGAVVKNSDKQRALTLVKVKVVDSASLKEASDKLVASGYAKIKCRITTDCTGAGLNAAAYSPSFNYACISDALRQVDRNSFLAKGDISRYFFSFPLAEQAKDMFGFRLKDQLYRYNCLPFGLTNCPYYASTWSAEFNEWFGAAGIDAAFMVDDYFLARRLESAAKGDMDMISNILEDCGVEMEKSKFGLGQQLTFLGLLIDTISMTIRIEPVHAAAFSAQLSEYRHMLISGASLPLETIRSTSGKLNWFSEVIQSGRLHIKHLWDCVNGRKLTKSHVGSLLRDFDWWIDKLNFWASGDTCGGQFPIVSSYELESNPGCIQLCQSDASGTDGYGYISSTLDSVDYNWTSKRWSGDENGLPGHSHEAEIRALYNFILDENHTHIKLIIWITDSESGCGSINKGNCKDPKAYPYLVMIYDLCDKLNIQLLALWVPREVNRLTDYLSHLAFISCRDSIQGRESF
jgi:hypothetical protein